MTQVASCRSKNQEKNLIHCEAVRKRENHIIWNLDLMVVKKMGKKKKEINCLLACQSVKNLSSGFFFLSFFFFFCYLFEIVAVHYIGIELWWWRRRPPLHLMQRTRREREKTRVVRGYFTVLVNEHLVSCRNELVMAI